MLIRILSVVLAALPLAGVVNAAVFTVTNTGDSGPGTLRQALLDANASNDTPHTIAFNIPGSGARVIQVQTPLPEILRTMTIDGYTQPGAQPNSQPTGGTDGVVRIELVGNDSITLGLSIKAIDVTVRGLSIYGFGAAQVSVGSTRARILGNYLCMRADGTSIPGAGQRNGRGAVLAFSDAELGRPFPQDRNLISGCALEGVLIQSFCLRCSVQGNLIGTDRSGLLPRGNLGGGIRSTMQGDSEVIIGGVGLARGNTISGNSNFGLQISGVIGTGDGTARGHLVQGNRIGTAVDGVSPIPNTVGLRLGGGSSQGFAAENRIGGEAPGSRNRIAGNSGAGIQVIGDSSHGNDLRGNEIFLNGALGIDLGADGVTANDPDDADAGPNGLQNFPELLEARVENRRLIVRGELDRPAGVIPRLYSLDFHASLACDPSGHGEGEIFLDNQEVSLMDAPGFPFGERFNLSLALAPPAGTFLTATATDTQGNTSEFSACIPVTLGDVIFAFGFEQGA